MRKILTIIFLLNYLAGFSQIEQDSIEGVLSKNVDILIMEAKKGNPLYYDKDLITPISNYPRASYYLFKKYENDSSQNVLQAVIANYKWLKKITIDTLLRKEITYNLLQVYKQYKQPLNNYNVFDIPSELSDPERSQASDFNANAKELLAELLQDSLINKRILKAVGIAGMKDQVPELRKFLPEGERYRKPRFEKFYFSSWEWYARLAMARLGGQEQIGYCVNNIENSKEEIMSNSYAAGNYFDDLAYIKQFEVLPFLFDMLLSNEKFPDDPMYSTSYFALGTLTRLLKGFPPEVGTALTEQGEKYYKEWVRQNKGKYEFKD